MSLNMIADKKIHSFAGAFIIALLAPSGAEAQLVGFYRAADLTSAEEAGLAALAEGRKGLRGSGDYEYDILTGTGALVNAQYEYWGNGAPTPFSFSYVASTHLATFSVAGLAPVGINLGSGASFSDIYIRAAAKSSTNISSTTLSNLTLSVGGGAAQSLQAPAGVTTITANSFAGGGSSAALLRFTDVISDEDDFVIQGVSTFTWTGAGTEPQRSNLAYQLKVGDFPDIPPIPEPSTYGLAGVGMIAAIVLYRRRQRSGLPQG